MGPTSSGSGANLKVFRESRDPHGSIAAAESNRLRSPRRQAAAKQPLDSCGEQQPQLYRPANKPFPRKVFHLLSLTKAASQPAKQTLGTQLLRLSLSLRLRLKLGLLATQISIITIVCVCVCVNKAGRRTRRSRPASLCRLLFQPARVFDVAVVVVVAAATAAAVSAAPRGKKTENRMNNDPRRLAPETGARRNPFSRLFASCRHHHARISSMNECKPMFAAAAR